MKSTRPYVIAEVSANHDNNIDVAKAIITSAASAGAQAIKLQTFTAELMTTRSDAVHYNIPSSSPLWSGKNLFELMKEAETPLEWHSELFSFARQLGLDAFSTPYHPSSIEFLLGLGVSALKISSFDVINHPLLHEVAAAGLPVIISVGMSSLEEIDEAVAILKPSIKNLIILKCTSSYPCAVNDANLLGIETLRQRYGTEVGFSDHTIGNLAAVVATGLGATVFEKHLKAKDAQETLDSEFSIGPADFKVYVNSIKEASLALGDPRLRMINSESASYWERPSLIALRDINQGEIFDQYNVGVRRPAVGLPPKKFVEILGRKCKKTLLQGEGITDNNIME